MFILQYFKKALYLVCVLIVISIILLESSYYYTAHQLGLKKPNITDYLGDTISEVLWVSLQEKGDINIQTTSASFYVFNFLQLINSGDLKNSSAIMGQGSRLAYEAARLSFFRDEKRVFGYAIDSTVSSIWLRQNLSPVELISYVTANDFFGPEIFGVDKASQYYFNKPTSRLNLDEIISLFAIAKGPSYYSPYRRKARLIKESARILKALQQNWPEKYAQHILKSPIFENH